MLTKYIRNKKGMALALVLMIFAVVIIIATTGLALSVSETSLGISSQKYVESYYIARAAADVISADVLNKLEAINKAASDYADSARDDVAQEAYFDELQRINDYHLIPEDGGTCNVQVAQINSNPVSVTIKNTSFETYDITATNSMDERPATVKVRIGDITPVTSPITVRTKNALYSWGNIKLGTNGDIYEGAAYSGGTITARQNTDIEKIIHDTRDIGIVVPPNEEMVDRRTDNLAKFDQMVNNSGIVNLSKSDNGNYGVLQSTAPLNWTVNTNQGDVYLVFSKIVTTAQAGTIRVNGNHNLYIFIVQNASVTYPTVNISGENILFSAKNQFSIQGKTDSEIVDGIELGLKPKTYVIGYNSNMQNWVRDNEGSKTVPYESQPTINTAAEINNGTAGGERPILDAYFYLPNMNISMGNNPIMTGSLFAGNIDIGNGLSITYRSFNDPIPDFIEYASVADTISVEQVTTYNLGNINKQWIR